MRGRVSPLETRLSRFKNKAITCKKYPTLNLGVIMSTKLDHCCVKDCENKGTTSLLVPGHGSRMVCNSHYNYVSHVNWKDTDIFMTSPLVFEILSRSPLPFTGKDLAIMRADPGKFVKPEKIIWMDEMTAKHDAYRKKDLNRFFSRARSRHIILTNCTEKPYIETPLTDLQRLTIKQFSLSDVVEKLMPNGFDLSSLTMFRIGIISLEASHNFAGSYMSTKLKPFQQEVKTLEDGMKKENPTLHCPNAPKLDFHDTEQFLLHQAINVQEPVQNVHDMIINTMHGKPSCQALVIIESDPDLFSETVSFVTSDYGYCVYLKFKPLPTKDCKQAFTVYVRADMLKQGQISAELLELQLPTKNGLEKCRCVDFCYTMVERTPLGTRTMTYHNLIVHIINLAVGTIEKEQKTHAAIEAQLALFNKSWSNEQGFFGTKGLLYAGDTNYYKLFSDCSVPTSGGFATTETDPQSILLHAPSSGNKLHCTRFMQCFYKDPDTLPPNVIPMMPTVCNIAPIDKQIKGPEDKKGYPATDHPSLIICNCHPFGSIVK
jgi:hypothetical protein